MSSVLLQTTRPPTRSPQAERAPCVPPVFRGFSSKTVEVLNPHIAEFRAHERLVFDFADNGAQDGTELPPGLHEGPLSTSVIREQLVHVLEAFEAGVASESAVPNRRTWPRA